MVGLSQLNAIVQFVESYDLAFRPRVDGGPGVFRRV
jgi:hypothetical protein